MQRAGQAQLSPALKALEQECLLRASASFDALRASRTFSQHADSRTHRCACMRVPSIKVSVLVYRLALARAVGCYPDTCCAAFQDAARSAPQRRSADTQGW